MNGNAAKIFPKNVAVITGEQADQIASLKERMAACQKQMCALLDETLALGLKWNFNLTESEGRHSCAQTLIREY